MKKILIALTIVMIFTGCSKKSNPEPKPGYNQLIIGSWALKSDSTIYYKGNVIVKEDGTTFSDNISSSFVFDADGTFNCNCGNDDIKSTYS